MIGQRLAERYLIQTELGRGGMGVVYRAVDERLKREVAVKVVSASALGTEGRGRLLQEAQAAAGLNHPNIVAVYDVDEAPTGEGGEIAGYIVMELVEGRSLHGFRPASIQQLVDLGLGMCAALEAAHDKGIIHRDLKPENILLTPELKVKLSDFGLARVTGGTRLTREGAVMGTVSYLAPEIISGRSASVRSDLYALGVVLYELAAVPGRDAHGHPLPAPARAGGAARLFQRGSAGRSRSPHRPAAGQGAGETAGLSGRRSRSARRLAGKCSASRRSS
jgi:serine/threonine protein kinase